MASAMLKLEFSWAGDDTDWSGYRRCEVEVLGSWYGDTPEDLVEAYGGYEDRTIFFGLRRPDGRVVGFCRVIAPGAGELKTISDITAPPWSVDGVRAASAAGLDLAHTWDIATIGVERRLGGAGALAAAGLYYAVFNAAMANGIRWITAIVDQRVRSILAANGLVVHALPGTGPAYYMGSAACAPVYAYLPDLVAHQRRVAPDAHRLIILGVGLDGIAVPPPDTFRLPQGWPVARPAENLTA